MDNNQTTGDTPMQSSASTSGGAHSVVPVVIAFVALLVAAIAVYFFMGMGGTGYMSQSPSGTETGSPTTGLESSSDANANIVNIDPANIPVGTEDPEAAALSTQGVSDDVTDITRDLEGTNMDVLSEIDMI